MSFDSIKATSIDNYILILSFSKNRKNHIGGGAGSAGEAGAGQRKHPAENGERIDGGDQLLCQRFEGLFERAGGGVLTGWVEVK